MRCACQTHLLLQLVDHVFLFLLQPCLQLYLLAHELQHQQCMPVGDLLTLI